VLFHLSRKHGFAPHWPTKNLSFPPVHRHDLSFFDYKSDLMIGADYGSEILFSFKPSNRILQRPVLADAIFKLNNSENAQTRHQRKPYKGCKPLAVCGKLLFANRDLCFSENCFLNYFWKFNFDKKFLWE
jgi:hypothetical protein